MTSPSTLEPAPAPRLAALAVVLLGALLSPAPSRAVEPEPGVEPAPGAEPGLEEPVEPPPTWRFRHDDKPVKVVVLAGSIGAWARQSYAVQLQGMCTNVEVRNISQTGLGAWALKQRFQQQVLDNPHLRWNVDGQEHWLVFGGGLNSVGNPRSTNHHMRRLFELAHRRGMKVVGLTLTPWGDDRDKRWRGVNGLRSRRMTKHVVDYTMGRLTPGQALGALANERRVGADAPWDPTELADVAIDLYDSPLRNHAAPLRDHDEMRTMLAKSKDWRRATAQLDELQRQTKLEADVQEAVELPRWYLRKELRSFDHIHPNEQGHRLIAEIMCPSLPESWGCSCPSLADAQPDVDEPPDADAQPDVPASGPARAPELP